jgi:hypothetical protein
MVRISVKIVMALAFIACFSCEDQGIIVKCPDCFTDEPASANLDVKLEPGFFTTTTLVKVYEGDIEDSVLYATYNVSGTTTTISVTLNKKYTVTASYYIADNYYIAVDSATPRVRYEKDQCDDPCYFVYDKGIDLRLKYTK